MAGGRVRSGIAEAAGSGPAGREQVLRRFHLVFRDPDNESFWRWSDRKAKVEITESEMIWTVEGSARVWPFGSIRSIRLEMRAVPGGADMFHATIIHEDWRTAQFFSSRQGQAGSPENARAYRAFVLALHDRLAAAGATPTLTAGAATSPVMMAAFIAVCLLSVGLPIAGLVTGRLMEGLGMAAAGAALVYPLYRTKTRNRIESYTLREPPARMLPPA